MGAKSLPIQLPSGSPQLGRQPLTNQSVDFRLSVLQGAMDGTAVYVEEQPATTNNFGLANLLVGSGMPSLGSLSAVDWANGPYFLQIELDIQNGEGYQLMGTSALASVPYALHAKTSEQAGPEGPQGEPGEQGPAGEQGEAGAGVAQVEIINDSLWLTLTTGEIQNAGRVVPALDSLMEVQVPPEIAAIRASRWAGPERLFFTMLDMGITPFRLACASW